MTARQGTRFGRMLLMPAANAGNAGSSRTYIMHVAKRGTRLFYIVLLEGGPAGCETAFNILRRRQSTKALVHWRLLPESFGRPGQDNPGVCLCTDSVTAATHSLLRD